ncbi:hypothetical protein [Hymenobacter sp. YC55]|uniref:hypothetical protein n=1 Tax=Hymenobacter sp. YC55 TaxID=3034019 RepID=UPI0023F8ED02|nr:hypothetical protein [Hymenobacter sp. YC55]MDF7814077.1 hypothetical protein [Hymenobacter sp. YC55]
MSRPLTLEARQQRAAQGSPVPPTTLERPAYAVDFAEWLAYRFTQVTAEQVSAVLHTHFPAPDQLDCIYLRIVLAEIETARHCEREVGCGVAFVYGGIEYQAAHIANARRWVANVEEKLGTHDQGESEV